MYAGKTDTMIKDIKAYVKGYRKCIIVKHASDVRYSTEEKITTHDGVSYIALPSTRLSDVMDTLMQHEVIGIDEGSFFTDIYPCVMQLVSAGKQVVISLLDGGFNGKLFIVPDPVIKESWVDLLPYADTHVKITGVCAFCGSRSASMTMRFGTDEELVKVGADAEYQTCCRDCWQEYSGGTGLCSADVLVNSSNVLTDSSSSE